MMMKNKLLLLGIFLTNSSIGLARQPIAPITPIPIQIPGKLNGNSPIYGPIENKQEKINSLKIIDAQITQLKLQLKNLEQQRKQYE